RSYYTLSVFHLWWFFFFFQAEDGIRDFHVTGVQTCALPIFAGWTFAALLVGYVGVLFATNVQTAADNAAETARGVAVAGNAAYRSEERRVGKEGRSRWAPRPEKKKK